MDAESKELIQRLSEWVGKAGPVIALAGGPVGIAGAAMIKAAPFVVGMFLDGKDPATITLDDLKLVGTYGDAIRAGGIDPKTGEPLPGAVRP